MGWKGSHTDVLGYDEMQRDNMCLCCCRMVMAFMGLGESDRAFEGPLSI
jgi:hypothetical protein